MKVAITNQLILSEIPERIYTVICERLIMPNPKWHENEKMDRWNGDTPRLLRFYERTNTGLIIPRGYIRHLINLCRQSDVDFHLDDQRRVLPQVGLAFNGQLKPFQQDAQLTQCFQRILERCQHLLGAVKR